MSLLPFLLATVVGGLLVGALARLAVPGPDPMPLWLTAAFGIAGSVVGGFAARLLLGTGGGFIFAVAGATALVLAYRRFVQQRPIIGPGARLSPGERAGTSEELRKLAELREAGVLTEEEFIAAKARLPARSRFR